MATVDEQDQRAADAEEHRRNYQGIMKGAAEIGVPLALAGTMFSTQLVLANGLFVAFLSFVGVYLFVWWVVKTFFTH